MSSLLGPSYDYWKSIKQPSEMGMSPGFSLGALATNVDGLLSYVEVLISGTGNASVTGKPLGNKFFLKTTGKCSETTTEKWKKERDEDEAWDRAYEEVGNKEGAKEITEDEATKLRNALNEQKKKRDEQRSKEKKIVDRWMYVNNIPDGSIPFIASGADGQSFNDLRGLIPGALGNLGALSPVQLFNGFTAGTYPDCAKVTLETVDNDNVRRSEARHVALVEIVEMNPCQFQGKTNPASGKRGRNCPDGFNSMGAKNGAGPEKKVDIYTQQYSIVSENGESVGIYEMGSLAGSSGVAYQTSHRSPLSFNMDITKSTPVSGLSYGKFERGDGAGTGIEKANAREVMEKHNANAGSFYKQPVSSSTAASAAAAASSPSPNASLYDDFIQRLSSLMEPSVGTGEDKSDIRGDMLSQAYYYGITAIMLYLLYKMLYRKNRK
jgi:hypothetical protein